ncbi:MAG TPA: efflux RND transporter periplasmic adaptor subunit [Candidatus Acidoferrales bacterium]|jgi:RND family efflux transporter MFP subunit
MIFKIGSSAQLKRTGWPMLAALLILAGVWAGCGNAPVKDMDDPANAPSAAVVKVVRRDLTSNLEIASEFQPFQEIQVYAKVSGYIQKSYIDWGMHVKQGQLLAVLEIPELQQQLQQDEASVKRSQQALEGAREELKRAESVYNVAHVTYTRLADVQKTRPDLLAQQDVDVAQGKDLEANAGVSSARDALAAAEQGVVGTKAALDKDKALFAYARITAPFDGVVTQVYAFTGALLPAGTSSGKDTLALCQLSQNNLLRLVIPLPERAVSDVHIGESVAVRLTNPPKTFQGTIVRFSDQIDEQTRTMHAEVHVPNPKDELVTGMYASVLIPLHTAAHVLTLPIQVVQSAKESAGTVFVVNSSNHIEQRAVTLGLQTATQVEIVSGLQENEMVIFGEQAQYRVGELVSPKLVESGGKE